MKVKICGIGSAEDAAMCEDLGADALGLIYYHGKKRHLPLDRISEICSSVGPMTKTVVVCAPGTVAEALDTFGRSDADAMQLYTLAPKELRELRAQGVPVIRAVPPDRAIAMGYTGCADALLFERGQPGTGSAYDYSQVPIDVCERAIIGGGLTPGNLIHAKSMRPYALDVSSGVEGSDGRKDPKLVEEFVRRCKA